MFIMKLCCYPSSSSSCFSFSLFPLLLLLLLLLFLLYFLIHPLSLLPPSPCSPSPLLLLILFLLYTLSPFPLLFFLFASSSFYSSSLFPICLLLLLFLRLSMYYNIRKRVHCSRHIFWCGASSLLSVHGTASKTKKKGQDGNRVIVVSKLLSLIHTSRYIHTEEETWVIAQHVIPLSLYCSFSLCFRDGIKHIF